MIPRFDHCLICDAVRQELRGKLIILGFLGICPNVNVSVEHLDQPTPMTFMLSGGPGDGSFSATFEIAEQDSGRVVVSVPGLQVSAKPSTPTVIVLSLLLTFGQPATYALQFTIGASDVFRSTFQVRQGIVE